MSNSRDQIEYRENGNIDKIERVNGDVEFYFNDENNRKALSVSKDGKCVFYFNNTQNLPCIEYNEKKYYIAQKFAIKQLNSLIKLPRQPEQINLCKNILPAVKKLQMWK